MIKFGTGGWRAVIGDDFIRENIQKVAQGVCCLVKEKKAEGLPVVLGYDRRFLSPRAMQWVSEVFAGNRLNILVMHRSTPTPLIMYIVKEKGYEFGLEITASHNPSDYNGIKLIVREGRDASVEVTSHLEKIIEGLKPEDVLTMPFDDAVREGYVSYLRTPFNNYMDSILSMIDQESIRQSGLRVLFDPMHGSGAYPLNTILTTCRCTIDLMNSNKDAFFGGHDPAPGLTQLSDLRSRVIAEHYDLGIALDGDGDRLGIVGPDGEYLSANKILVMLYYYLHEYKGWKGLVVRNLATTHMLDSVAQSFGETCYEVPVGFKWISSKMDEVDAVLGGESSGGLTVRGHIHGKDSVYAGSLFVEMLSRIGKSLNDYWNELETRYGRFCMSEANFKFRPEDRAGIDKLIMTQKKLPDFENQLGKKVLRVNYEDGCKVYFDDAFVICRFSGTEPLLRIFAEDKTPEQADALIDCFKKFLS